MEFFLNCTRLLTKYNNNKNCHGIRFPVDDKGAERGMTDTRADMATTGDVEVYKGMISAT